MSFEQLTLYAATHPDEKIFVYSYDISKNQYVPALATNIGIRQYVNKIARVTLDDGGVIHCTTDHLFLTQDRGYVEAKDLYSGESLVPLYTRTNKDGIEEIYNNNHWDSISHDISEEEHNKSKHGRKSSEEKDRIKTLTGQRQISKIIRDILDNEEEVNEDTYIKHREKVSKKAPKYDNITPRYFDSMKQAIESGTLYNHKVVSVEIMDTLLPTPMYCLTVEGYQNFAICDNSYTIDPISGNKIYNCVTTHNCTDADSAGFFIESLLLRLVLRFCPQLILAGKYYKSVAPLYYITTGKGKNKKKLYFTDRIELVQYVQKQFSKSNTITTMDDKKLSQIQIQELLYNNIDYIYELEKVANRYRIAPDILEIYLNNRDKKPEDICKAIKKKYRFMNQIVIDGKVVCDGIANGVSNTLILDDKMINDCSNIIKIIEGNLYTMYKVNGVPCTLLDLMTAYTKFQPNDLTRLKGLGEQSGEELAESVILPGDMGNRTLLQYTMDSAMKEIEQIRHFESNKNLLLEGLVVNRIDISD